MAVVGDDDCERPVLLWVRELQLANRREQAAGPASARVAATYLVLRVRGP